MEGFKQISTEEIGSAFKLIGSDWMLISAGTEKAFNAMTASWGCMGVLWNKPVCIGYIRPQRYTYDFAEVNELMTMCFFGEEKREALKYCGTHSGRDEDKMGRVDLTPIFCEDGGAVIYKEAKLALVCRKLYISDIEEDGFLDSSLLSNYPQKDYHRQYICEIIKAYEPIK